MSVLIIQLVNQILEWVNPRSQIKRQKPIQFLQFCYINKSNRKFHWVVKSDLKELDINNFFKRKQMIEDMEAELTEASEINSKTDNSQVTEEANVDETVTAESKSGNKTGIDPQK